MCLLERPHIRFDDGSMWSPNARLTCTLGGCVCLPERPRMRVVAGTRCGSVVKAAWRECCWNHVPPF